MNVAMCHIALWVVWKFASLPLYLISSLQYNLISEFFNNTSLNFLINTSFFWFLIPWLIWHRLFHVISKIDRFPKALGYITLIKVGTYVVFNKTCIFLEPKIVFQVMWIRFKHWNSLVLLYEVDTLAKLSQRLWRLLLAQNVKGWNPSRSTIEVFSFGKRNIIPHIPQFIQLKMGASDEIMDSIRVGFSGVVHIS